MNRSAEEKRIVMEQWSEWFPMLESGGNLRNPGAALAPGGAVLRRNSDGIATDTTLAEVKELVGGCTLMLLARRKDPLVEEQIHRRVGRVARLGQLRWGR